MIQSDFMTERFFQENTLKWNVDIMTSLYAVGNRDYGTHCLASGLLVIHHEEKISSIKYLKKRKKL